MRFLNAFIFLFVLILSSSGQTMDDVLATAAGHNFRIRDLSATTQKDVADLPVNMAKGRVAVLDQMISQRVYDANLDPENRKPKREDRR